MSETTDAIRGFIEQELLFDDPDKRITDDTVLLEGLIDSLGLMQLIAFIEEEFSVQIDDSMITAEHFSTVSSIEKVVAASGS